ncbi:hypothetical protein TNCV_4663581 [Trichonephila clavipes]|uniref:Uncharacterized protein n=1 Tax=Trichonephila clavipes TaxID=2585209 RepID=A0A8X6S846_TRICX|nr:hypothetical protein TNCV_4663581 [Trichonephila clavipes]
MVMAELQYECITCSFLIDECQITEFFSGYIFNFKTGSFHVTRHDAGRRRAASSSSLEESILNVVVLPELLQDVPIAIPNRVWFQYDGAPAHFSTVVRMYPNATFGARWIGCGEPDIDLPTYRVSITFYGDI